MSPYCNFKNILSQYGQNLHTYLHSIYDYYKESVAVNLFVKRTKILYKIKLFAASDI